MGNKEQIQIQLRQNRFLKRAALWSFAAFLIGGVIFGLIKFNGNTFSGQTVSLSNVISVSDWTKGNQKAKIIIIEYSDFQCPACGFYYPLIKQLVVDFNDKIQFTYRHFPLKQIHQNAELAAFAAEAAGKQMKFWEMHDLIFENQSKWSDQINAKNTFLSYAQSLQLDIERFKNDLDSKEIKEKVKNDYQSGIQSGVNSTPTFFLNDRKIQNPRNYDKFRNIIKQAVNTNS
ncbi:thioredoxin domain-containing protein [Candidatus Wolfebacteria bacterium]|nr:thioredoxin domain-containing protein [Candidatus Wolfebacteria bacterium]